MLRQFSLVIVRFCCTMTHEKNLSKRSCIVGKNVLSLMICFSINITRTTSCFFKIDMTQLSL